jgi:type IV pilus assembly protein PilN
MAEINLLPWRENLHNAVKKEFLIIFIVAICLAMLILVISVKGIKSKIGNQERLNSALQNGIAVLEPKMYAIKKIKIKLNSLGMKKDALEQLQLERMSPVRLLEQVAYQIPPGVYLTRFDKKGAQLTFEGVAESNLQASELMQKITRSRWFAEAHLSEIKAVDNKEGSRGYYFKMTARYSLLK